MSTIHTAAYVSARVAEEFWHSVARRIGKPQPTTQETS